MMKNLNPAVDKKLLLILAGVVWLIVGILLCNLASEWLTQTSASNAFWFGLFGITLALFIYHFGFLKLVRQNSERILTQKDRLCIFSFQPWKSYITVVIMIGMGMTLRHSSLPKQYLAIIYIGFGLAMLLSSLKYFWIFLRKSGKL